MAKLRQVEDLVGTLSRHQGVVGCAVASRQGQADILYDSNLGGSNPSLLSTMITSLLMIGEKLGQELADVGVDYQLIGTARATVLILPGGEEVALMVLLKDTEACSAIIEQAREVARNIGALLRNKAGEA